MLMAGHRIRTVTQAGTCVPFRPGFDYREMAQTGERASTGNGGPTSSALSEPGICAFQCSRPRGPLTSAMGVLPSTVPWLSAPAIRAIEDLGPGRIKVDARAVGNCPHLFGEEPVARKVWLDPQRSDRRRRSGKKIERDLALEVAVLG